MIFVLNKGNVPNSLAYPTIGKISETTHKYRMKLIDVNTYINEDIYNDRYKQDDTKAALEKCHNRKCAYCEQVVEATHVEHYRPKSLYWWLAYSWDNLLRVCPTCNTHKGNYFEISRKKAEYNPQDLSRIHTLRDIYNQLEIPSLLNPECDNLTNMWIFGKQGEMRSNQYRGTYTINTLKLDRDFLRDLRKKIIVSFEKKATSLYFLHGNDPTKLFEKLSELVAEFIQMSNDSEENFLAFRHYAAHHFVNDIILEFYP